MKMEIIKKMILLSCNSQLFDRNRKYRFVSTCKKMNISNLIYVLLMEFNNTIFEIKCRIDLYDECHECYIQIILDVPFLAPVSKYK